MNHLLKERPERAPATAERAPVRILLVDDTPQNLLALEAMLDDPTLTLVRASSGNEALRHVLKEDFAAILLDVLMPGMDGLETAALIRERERSRHTPIIFVTAAGGDDDLLARGYGLGAVDYIVKPIRPVILRSKVAVFVELFRKNAKVSHQAAQLARLNADLEARVRERTAEVRAAQAAAEQERDRLRQVIDVLPEAVLIIDAAGHVVSRNAAAQDAIGIDPLGRSLQPTGEAVLESFELRRIDGSALPARDRPPQRSLADGVTVHGAQLLARNARDGRDVPILLNSAPLSDAGRITGAVVVFQDISALKSLERQKDEFLATVSHDLKNPLTGISGMAQLLQRRLDRSENLDLARLDEGLSSIRASALQAARLLTELVDLTRLEMERPLDLNKQQTNLVELVQRVAEVQQQATEQHVVRVEAVAPAIDAECDPMRMERVLGNLLSNAVKYSPEGGEIAVMVGSEDAADGSWAVLEVRDQGMGIPAEDLPHVFDRFYRGSNVASGTQGSGLGLASVRQIVEQHGGAVTVDRNPDRGSTFTVRLPMVRASQAHEVARSPARP